VIGTLLYGLTLYLFLGILGIAAYQVAVLSLLVTMIIGVWLVWPVRDDRPGSEEVSEVTPIAPPERLVPATAPVEPRDR
jgi:hypothetical protein